MAGRIPKDFIDDLIARTDIVELVDSRVKLKKAGKNYQACCPFHSEKSPSFTVSQDKQFYHCFGCGAHGNAISFVIEYDRLEFPEAVEELARFHSLEVPREQGAKPGPTPQQKAQIADDYQLMEQAARFFEHQLKQHEQKNKPIDYLKQRGLSGEIVKAFGIGYAPPEWDSIFKQFGTSPEKQQQLLDLKLITENDNRRRYDFFRDRIMFPIRDKRGRVIGFGGRVLEDGGPKYLNSPETRIFHKGHELYGFYQAKQANRKLERLMIVEGYMDVVALAQFGIDYAVASLGTSTTPEHIQMLFRAAPEIICCYDGDRAGRDAAWRALENALPQLKDGVEMKFLFLPDGEDPDTLVRKTGKAEFETLLSEKSVPLSQFFFENLIQQFNVGSSEGKAALTKAANEYIEQIHAENLVVLLKEELRKKIKGDSYKADILQDIKQANSVGKAQKLDYQMPNKNNMSPVRKLLRLLLLHPNLARKHPDIQPSALNPDFLKGLHVLIKMHSFCASESNIKTGHVLEHFRHDPEAKFLHQLLQIDHDADDNRPDKLYIDSFNRLIEQQLKARYQQLLAKGSAMTMDEKMEFKLLTQTKATYSAE
ncbi:DNA primase [Aliiglaciecola lipolytica]|uniref:DNA primase n=1 Tax=Aliiglaciecola lipolytica E3 TaxID=1127673 RepID=K6YB39_9ALTE|nr:DNA primase [Aliiglaciecola lipolytica]GAC15397.1 DNA primase [Aliiglaciecola lipolytica E3]